MWNAGLDEAQAGIKITGRNTNNLRCADDTKLMAESKEEKERYLLYASKQNCGKFLKIWEYQTTWPAFWEICMQVKKHQLELDMEQHTGSKLGKEYFKAVYCYPAYLTYMQSSSCEMLGWMKHKLESRL